MRRLVVTSLLVLVVAAPRAAAGPPSPVVPRGWSPVGLSGDAFFGASIAPAGDVDGDGFGDVLVGASGQDATPGNHEGVVYLYRGTATGLATTHSWSWSAGAWFGQTGFSVASAGDVNKDGYADVIVGTPNWIVSVAGVGRASIFHGGPGGLALTPNRDLFPPTPGQFDWFGRSVATAGDVNGDGYADVIVGAPNASRGGVENRGLVAIFHGGPDGVSSTPARTLLGAAQGDEFGRSVSTAGDVDADGYADVIVGAPFAFEVGTRYGKAYLHLGSVSGVLAAADTALVGATPFSSCGHSVANAGDVDGDGYADVIVGQPAWDTGAEGGGRADVWRGGPGGLRATPLFTVKGNGTAEGMGMVVATLGDLDGDGYADFGVAAPDVEATTPAGRVLVHRGGPAGPSLVGEVFGDPVTGGWFGNSLATTGDVDGDGFAEILVGDESSSFAPGVNQGQAFLYGLARRHPVLAPHWPRRSQQFNSSLGRALAILPRLHVNGTPTLAVGEPWFDGPGGTDAGQVRLFAGSRAGVDTVAYAGVPGGSPEELFGDVLADAGDVNGDGFSDLLVSATRYSGEGGPLVAGRVALVPGGASPVFAAQTLLIGTGDFEFAGSALAGRADFDGDGHHDVAIGSPYFDGAAGEDCGRVSVYYGSASGLEPTPQTIQGLAAGQVLGSTLAIADFDGDGYSDLAISSVTDEGDPAVTARVQMHYGGPAGLGPLAWSIQSREPDPTFGAGLAAVGDQNGDGVCDLAVGAPGRSIVRLYALSASRARPAEPMWYRSGGLEFTSFGTTLAGGGDVDGDGRPDFVIAEHGYDGASSNSGRVHLWYGGAFEPTESVILEHDGASSNFGIALAPLADVNADGFADVVVGAIGDTSYVHVFLGGGGGVRRTLTLFRPDGGDPPRFAPRWLASGEWGGAYVTLRSAEGRARLIHQWEHPTQATAFPGTPPPILSPVFDTGAPVAGVGSEVELHGPLTLPWNGVAYAVRGRSRSASPFFPHSRWLRPEARELAGADFVSAGASLDVGPASPLEGRVFALRAAPNPSSRATPTRIEFTTPGPGRIVLSVFDARGARVRALGEAAHGGGPGTAGWDGRDDEGRLVPAGIYFVEMRADGAVTRAKLVRLP